MNMYVTYKKHARPYILGMKWARLSVTAACLHGNDITGQCISQTVSPSLERTQLCWRAVALARLLPTCQRKSDILSLNTAVLYLGLTNVCLLSIQCPVLRKL